jgi:long-chain acyl-CoA synthetase
MNLGAFLTRNAMKYPDKVCLIDYGTGKRLTYEEFNKRVNRLANGLKSLGLRKGKRAGLFMTNRIEWPEIYYALSKLGTPLVQLNFNLKPDELLYVIKHSGLSLLFIDEVLQQNIVSLLPHIKQVKPILLGSEKASWAVMYEDAFDHSNSHEPDVAIDEDNIHSICYTSGTTGLPKGAELTHANLIFGHYYQMTSEYGFSCNDNFLITTPSANRVAWGRLTSAISLGATACIMKKFSVKEAMEAIERERITVVSMVPTIARMILQVPNLEDYNTGSLRIFLLTGEAFPLETQIKLRDRFPDVGMISFYSSTETGAVSGLGPDDILEKPDSAGRPIAGVDVRIVDESDQDVAVGGAGEILMKCGKPGRWLVMKRYHNNPKATREAFLQGWFRTGDIGRLDEHGYLYIVDRKRDMIISGGYNVYGREVEKVIQGHPTVKEVAVVGVPDNNFGEAVKAFVVLKDNQRVVRSDVLKNEIMELCKEKMAGYKKPKYIEFIDALPRNQMGKVTKYVLRQGGASS